MRLDKIIPTLLVTLLPITGLVAQQPTQDPATEARIDALLSKMTVEEKVGQMAQYTLDVFGKGDDVYTSVEPFELDPVMLEKGFKKYRIGSVLNTANNRARTPEVWQQVISRYRRMRSSIPASPSFMGSTPIRGPPTPTGEPSSPQR